MKRQTGMKRRNRLALGTLLCALAGMALLVSGTASAERADRNKRVHVEADQVTIDDAKQKGIFVGDVVMTQGTLSINGDQVETQQGPGGFERGTATGKPAGFRQKREGANDYVEGSGTRIEYNAVSGIMDIYGQAHIKQGKDEARAEHIIYDTRKETFQISGAPEAVAAKPADDQAGQPSKDKRATVVINPRAASTPAPGEPLPIKPETRLPPPDNKP